MLIEIPNGDWVDPTEVLGLFTGQPVRPEGDYRVVVGIGRFHSEVCFKTHEAADEWRKEFARQVNDAKAGALAQPDAGAGCSVQYFD